MARNGEEMDSNVALGLDGSSVTHSSPDISLETNPTSRFIVAGENRELQEFVAGTRDFGHWVASRMRADFDQQYSYQGGTLRLGSSLLPDQFSEQTTTVRTGVWFGETYAVKTHVYGGVYDEIIALFDKFTISEGTRGVAMSPAVPGVSIKQAGAHAPSVAMLISDFLILHTYQLTEGNRASLPKWRGLATEHGELFADDEGEPTEVVILVTPTSITSLQPREGRSLDEVADFASRLAVEWSAPAELG